jgi:hypothetical protein
MPGKFRDAKFAEDTAKLIASVGGQPREPAKRVGRPKRKYEASPPKAKETAAAAQLLKDHARRRINRRPVLGQ